MTEFIVSLEQLQKLADKLEPEPKETYKVKITLPKIVRCRDCKYYSIVDETYDCDPIRGCGFLYFKGKRIDDDLQEPQDPDGFCAWGERKQ